MAGKSNYLAEKLLSWLRGTSMGASPTTYVGLFNGDPGDAGTGGAEVTTQIRAAGRLSVTFGAPSSSSGTASMSNDAVVNFGNAANSVAQVTHFGVFDAASSGNLLYSGPLTGQPIAIAAGNAVSYPVGTLVVQES